MLATLGEAPSGEGWAFEFKRDGARALVETDSARTYMWSRHRNNFSSHFSEIVAGVPAALGGRQAILDGEIVVLDAARRPSFSRLQRRLRIPTHTAWESSATGCLSVRTPERAELR